MASDDFEQEPKTLATQAAALNRSLQLNAPLVPLNVVLRDRVGHDAVRVVVKSVDWIDGRWTLEVDGRAPYRISGKETPAIAAGDTVLMLVSPKDRIAMVYFNESTRSSNLKSFRSMYRKITLWGVGFAVVAVAILITVFLALSHETMSGLPALVLHTPLYLLSILGAGFLLLLSLFAGFAVIWSARQADALEIVAFDDPELAMRKLERMEKISLPRKPQSNS